jgi:hypothetical protein
MTQLERAVWNRPWVESPLFESEAAARGLDAETLRRAREFRERGVLVLDLELPDELMDRIVEQTRPLHDPEVAEGPRSRIRVQDVWDSCPAVRELAAWGPVLDLLRTFYGREPIPFQTLNFQYGTEQRAHRDQAFFDTHPSGFMCAAWVALEDVGPENGAIFYYPGSHLPALWRYDELGLGFWNPLLSEKFDQERARLEYERYLQEALEASALERVDLRARRGSVVLWAAGLVHGGGRIGVPGRTRRSQVTHYFFSDCAFVTPCYSNPFTGDLYLRQIRDARTGAVVPSRFYGLEVEGVEENGLYRLLVDEPAPGRPRLRAVPNGYLKGLEEIAASHAYRIGRGLTAPLRALRGLASGLRKP